jgi:tetratricopeptide (TPR) repeat protein
MHPDFDLVVAANRDALTAELRLLDSAGAQVGYRALDIRTIEPSTLQGLFNLREFVHLYAARPGQSGRNEEELVADLGVSLAHEVLGAEIFGPLSASERNRTLRVRLPVEEENHLAAALARVPWEIARAAADEPTLAERNLVVRAVVGDDPVARPLALEKDESLRVLFVFAEARGSAPLAAREERKVLQALFEQEIYPKRRIEADFLAHGVTRERLVGLITDRRGYHIVHWSGHGHLDLLELAGDGGESDPLSGEDLVDLLRQAGGFQPQLFFLSACHSGDMLRIENWADFRAVAAGHEPGAKEAAETGEVAGRRQMEERPGYTGTAHALLRAGIPSVVAMRYAVGDDYARDLAVDFYSAVLAATNPPDVAEALNRARNQRRDATAYSACDHATPVLYGLADPGLPLPKGKSPYHHRRDPRLMKIGELNIREHPHFVGRTWELAELGARVIGHQRSASVTPVALVQGMGGMGKTALAAEAIDLWKEQFDWVLLFQAKPNALSLDTTLSDIHGLLYAELKAYHDHVQENPADAIWRAAEGDFRGEARMKRLGENLLRAMHDEAILLVLDNFETNLKKNEDECQDPEWDRLLALLAAELPGSASRVLLTCRRPIAAPHYPVVLGPLPAGEAALYLRSHPDLRRLLFSDDADERRLAQRVLFASRFHPLLLDRLARLVPVRQQLEEALGKLESAQGYANLPELFGARSTGTNEVAYLRDALESSIDLLIERAGPEGRRVLWMIALTNDPEALGLLRLVWNELAENPPAIEPLVDRLAAVGLVTAEREGPINDNPEYTCHELVRERIAAWIAAHPEERQGRDENAGRLACAERLVAVFSFLLHRNAETALEAGRRALVYCVQAGAYDRLGGFAGTLVTSAMDRRLMSAILPHLEAAAQSAPAGQARWRCRTYLADGLRRGGLPEASLAYYEQAAGEAQAAEQWSDVSWITGNWANALGAIPYLEASRAKYVESAEAARRAKRPQVEVIGRELEAYRIEILQARATEVLPAVEERVATLERWWQRTRTGGETVPEAPDVEFLARAVISALDIATDAHFALKNWDDALGRIDRILQVERALGRAAQAIAATRMNRAVVLTNLRRFAEAQSELELCLQIFRDDPAHSASVLSSLASLFDDQNDIQQAVELERRALALREQLPDPGERAISHHNLAIYLHRTGAPANLAESAGHQMAALIYYAIAGLGESLQISVRNYVIDFGRARDGAAVVPPPRVAELLAQPAFRPLAQWLDQRQVNREELQAAIDNLLARAREAAEAAE